MGNIFLRRVRNPSAHALTISLLLLCTQRRASFFGRLVFTCCFQLHKNDSQVGKNRSNTCRFPSTTHGVRFLKQSRAVRQRNAAWTSISYLRTASLELGDEGDVVALVLGVDVALLQNEADHGGGVLDSGGRGVLLKARYKATHDKDRVRDGTGMAG